MIPSDPPDFTATTQFEGLTQPNLRPVSLVHSAPSLPVVAPGWESLPLFSGMPDEARRHFREAMDDRDYAAGETIIAQGDEGGEMYVLERGTMRVTVHDENDVVVFERTIPAPTVFGEMALITNEPRSATITAEGPCHCLRIDKRTVKELFSRYSGTAVFLTRLVGERLMENQGIRRVGKYEVVGRLGSGGVATVFEAIHPTLGTPVALKMLSHALVFDEGFAEHFAEEARLVAKLDHPHITRVIDTEQAYGTHFIVMEKLTGQLLEEVVEESAEIGWSNARRILREIAEALAYSHDMGFIHRDIKPENVFLLTDGRVKLMDFGIATQSGNDAAGGKIFGTPYYMSPEQIMGKAVDGRSDLYSLGILAYELLTGDIPYDGDSVQELFAQHIHAPIPDVRDVRPDTPDDLIEFIARATAKKVDDRFEDLHAAARFLKVAAEVPVLDRFAMSSLSVTYHESMRNLVEQVMRNAAAALAGVKGVAFFEAHRGAGPSQNVSITTGEFPVVRPPPPSSGRVPTARPPQPPAFAPPPAPPTFAPPAPSASVPSPPAASAPHGAGPSLVSAPGSVSAPTAVSRADATTQASGPPRGDL